MNFQVTADGRFDLGSRVVRCALGRGGVCASEQKREGDGRTPAGLWPFRRVLWRADRRPSPVTALRHAPIGESDGWCDDPKDALYNQPVSLPHARSAERLWRDDALYDLLVVLGHNDDPVVPGAGSAIFLHVARPDFEPTEGCVAVAVEDLTALLSQARPGDNLQILLSLAGDQGLDR